MWIAARHPIAIISADSRQVYRGFDVGTAKPTIDDRFRVPHAGIDIIEPTERYSAAAWAAAAGGWIEDARAKGLTPVVVGGTGLYLRALFEGLFEEPPLDAARRERLEVALGAMDVSELRRWVVALDPSRAHLGRTQLIRAIEIAALTGRRVSDLHREHARRSSWRARYLLVDPGRPALNGHIATRIDDMLEHGWPEEVQRLIRTVPENAPAWKATGYDAVRRYVAGAGSRTAATETILIETRQYAKRQRTWFRHQLPAADVTLVNPLEASWPDAVEQWMHGWTRPTPAAL